MVGPISGARLLRSILYIGSVAFILVASELVRTADSRSTLNRETRTVAVGIDIDVQLRTGYILPGTSHKNNMPDAGQRRPDHLHDQVQS